MACDHGKIVWIGAHDWQCHLCGWRSIRVQAWRFPNEDGGARPVPFDLSRLAKLYANGWREWVIFSEFHRQRYGLPQRSCPMVLGAQRFRSSL